MTPSPDRRWPLLILFCWLAALCSATDLWEDSAFKPDVYSHFSSSLTAPNDTYGLQEPLVNGDGLFHPFQSWKIFTTSLLETFSPGAKQRALIQYAHADSSSAYRMETNFFAGYGYRWDDPGNYGFLYKGLRTNSRIGDNIRIRGTWWNGRFYGDEDAWPASPLIDGFTNQNSDGYLLDNINGDISYSGKHLRAALGRGKFQIGNSISSSVILSDRGNDYDFLLLEERFGALRFSFLHGTLMADSTQVPGTEEYPAKFLAAHQISWQTQDWLELFLGETVVYGTRFDFTYLLPVYFWRVGKYGYRDRDNLLIFAGANVQPSEDLTVWLHGALDELTYNKFYKNWWGNKYAIQAGAALALPDLALTEAGDPRCAVEFTAIRPWTYTHYANVSMYSHDRRPLGYAKGSNLLDASLELNLPLPARLHWDSTLSCTWQGSVGNDWRLNYKDFFDSEVISTAEADWLEGDVTFYCRLQNALRWDIMAHHSFLVGHSSDLAGTPRHQFFAGWQASF